MSEKKIRPSINPVYERLKKLCGENNISITSLCLEITGTKGNLSTWKTGSIRNDYLVKISERLNVSVDWILGMTQTQSTADQILADPDITTIRHLQEKMSPKDREKMMKLIRLQFKEDFGEDFGEEAADVLKRKRKPES